MQRFHRELTFRRQSLSRLLVPVAHSHFAEVPPALVCLIHVWNLHSAELLQTCSFHDAVRMLSNYSTSAIGRLRAISRKAVSNAAVLVVVYDSPPVVFAISFSKLVRCVIMLMQ